MIRSPKGFAATPEECALLAHYRGLPPVEQRLARELLEALAIATASRRAQAVSARRLALAFPARAIRAGSEPALDVSHRHDESA
jgi:hypothetical protein